MTFGEVLPGYEGISGLAIPTGSITGNFLSSSNPAERHAFLGLLESVSMVINKGRVCEYNDVALALRLYTAPTFHTWLSPTLAIGQASATELTGLTTSDPRRSLQERLLGEIFEEGVEDELIVSEPRPQAVDWERLRRLRDSWAHESDDLFEWYAQQEE